MSQRPPRILAIDPGTRYMGYAVLEGTELLYHGVKTLPRRASPHDSLRAVRLTVRTIIKHLHPTILALENTFFGKSRRSALLSVCADEIAALGRRRGLRVVRYAPPTIKKFISGNGRADKQDVAKMVCLRYPELRAFVGNKRQWKDRFHSNMFDAIALALLTESRR